MRRANQADLRRLEELSERTGSQEMTFGRPHGLRLRMSPPLLLQVRGPLRRADLPELYARACAELAGGRHRQVELEVSGVRADAVALDALAHLALAARRHGCRIALLGATSDLWQLIELSGLRDVFGG